MVKIELEPSLLMNEIGSMHQTGMVQVEKGRGKYGVIGV